MYSEYLDFKNKLMRQCQKPSQIGLSLKRDSADMTFLVCKFYRCWFVT